MRNNAKILNALNLNVVTVSKGNETCRKKCRYNAGEARHYVNYGYRD